MILRLRTVTGSLCAALEHSGCAEDLQARLDERKALINENEKRYKKEDKRALTEEEHAEECERVVQETLDRRVSWQKLLSVARRFAFAVTMPAEPLPTMRRIWQEQLEKDRARLLGLAKAVRRMASRSRSPLPNPESVLRAADALEKAAGAQKIPQRWHARFDGARVRLSTQQGQGARGSSFQSTLATRLGALEIPQKKARLLARCLLEEFKGRS